MTANMATCWWENLLDVVKRIENGPVKRQNVKVSKMFYFCTIAGKEKPDFTSHSLKFRSITVVYKKFIFFSPYSFKFAVKLE